MNRTLQHRQWARKNLDHVRAYKRKWNKTNRKKQTKYNRNWYRKHMYEPNVRSKHYKQNDRWRTNKRADYQLSNLKSGAFGYAKYSRDIAHLTQLIKMIGERSPISNIVPDSTGLWNGKPKVTATTMKQYFNNAKQFIRRTGNARMLNKLCSKLKAKRKMMESDKT